MGMGIVAGGECDPFPMPALRADAGQLHYNGNNS